MLTILCLPIFTSDWMMVPCMTTVPGPMDAYLEIIADGWTAVAYTSGYLFAIISRIRFEPILMIKGPTTSFSEALKTGTPWMSSQWGESS